MKPVVKFACMIGLGLLWAASLPAQQPQPCWGEPPQWYKDGLAEAKAMVDDLMDQTWALQWVDGIPTVIKKKAEYVRAKMIRYLTSAQIRLTLDADPETIYQAGIQVYRHIKADYQLYYSLGAISLADFQALDSNAQEIWYWVMYLYWNHPYWDSSNCP
jgi:hypothetical protein